MSAESVTFYFDFTSPYTYLASTQLAALADRTKSAIAWKPVLLGAVMKATGNTPPATLPARAKFMAADLGRWAAIYGVPFQWNPFFPIATQHALRAVIALEVERPELARPFTHAVFRATWCEGKNTGEREVLAALAREVGAPEELVLSATDRQEYKDRLRQNTEVAVAAGAFGAPTLVIGESELYFGNDRLDMLEKRLLRGKPF